MTKDEFIEWFQELPYKAQGEILLALGKAMLDKATSYTPHGAESMRLRSDDRTLSVILTQGDLNEPMDLVYREMLRHMRGVELPD